jgi:branched-chain amino acid transport system ATP-binding protein
LPASQARTTTTAEDGSPVLSVEAVSVRFGGVQAVTDANITALAGQITGLIGPNGAGKTTTFNVVTGLEKPTAGRVLVNGRDVSRLSPYRRARLGMARTFQRLEVFGSLSARDNVLAAAEFRRSWSGDKSEPQRVTDEILDLVGLRSVAGMRVDALPTGLARLVELGRALATRPQLLLLDEPGSGLDNTETEALGDLLIDLAAGGMAILLVEHDVDLVMRVCDRIHVLDFGKIISVGTTAEVQADPVVQAAYLGADVESVA